MKKALVFVGLVLVSLAVLLPFASSSPDGLEKVAGTFGAQQQTPIWQGLMPDYSVAALGNSCFNVACWNFWNFDGFINNFAVRKSYGSKKWQD